MCHRKYTFHFVFSGLIVISGQLKNFLGCTQVRAWSSVPKIKLPSELFWLGMTWACARHLHSVCRSTKILRYIDHCFVSIGSEGCRQCWEQQASKKRFNNAATSIGVHTSILHSKNTVSLVRFTENPRGWGIWQFSATGNLEIIPFRKSRSSHILVCLPTWVSSSMLLSAGQGPFVWGATISGSGKCTLIWHI